MNRNASEEDYDYDDYYSEAYGIANMDRGDELLNVLLQEMEDNPEKLIVILTGYTDEMRELMKANPGLSSRIAQEIHFDDYSQEELVRIFLQMCKKDGFTLDSGARDELEDCIGARMTREFCGNARDIRNMLQDLKEAWSEDFYNAITSGGQASSEVKRVFLPHHFEKIMPPKKKVSIHDLIGLEVLKNKLETFKRQAMYQKYLREKGFTGLSDFSMHMIFTGNPGTGKTTVAKLIADDLYSIGMLKTNRLVVAERKDMVSIHGDTAQKTADLIRKAVGGVLFIDEAHSYGRVILQRGVSEQIEGNLLAHIAILLSGKNAEKLILGSHSTGCANDYLRAKQVATDMIEKFAMNTFGTTPGEILQTAEETSCAIIRGREEKLERIVQILLEEKEITGKRFRELFYPE